MKSILVGLDLSEIDDHIIRYTSLICDSYKTDKVFFIHIAEDLELPEDVVRNYSDVFVSVDEGIKHKIQEKIDQNFNAETETHIVIEEGHAVDKILRFSKIKNADLIILGRKLHLKGKGIIPNTIARKSPCNLLLIPEGDGPKEIKKILIPTDFSKHSRMALDTALQLGHKNEAVISCVNIYDVPTGYSKTGKGYKEFAEIMLRHAKDNFKDFIKGVDDPIECNYILSKDHDFSDELTIYIQATKPDIVFIGSKGKTNTTVMLLGSMTEKLTTEIDKVPLFIVKKKGENLDIFHALLKI